MMIIIIMINVDFFILVFIIVLIFQNLFIFEIFFIYFKVCFYLFSIIRILSLKISSFHSNIYGHKFRRE